MLIQKWGIPARVWPLLLVLWQAQRWGHINTSQWTVLLFGHFLGFVLWDLSQLQWYTSKGREHRCCSGLTCIIYRPSVLLFQFLCGYTYPISKHQKGQDVESISHLLRLTWMHSLKACSELCVLFKKTKTLSPAGSINASFSNSKLIPMF